MERGFACKFVIAAIAASVAGYLIIGLVLHVLRICAAWFRAKHPERTIEAVERIYLRDSFAPIDFALGASERIVALSLFIWAPQHLATFIGAWVAAKLAANWQRIKSEKAWVREGSLIALIGSAISFGIAISIGMYIKPPA